MGIENNPSTAYHPQTDSQTERMNQELEQYLRLYINHHQSDWVDWLSIAVFAHNNQVHSATGYSPFYINYGFHPSNGNTLNTMVSNESATAFVDHMTCLREEVAAALKRASELMKASYDRDRRDAIDYKAGDLVWLHAVNLPSHRPSKKLDHRQVGPYVIDSKVGRSSYRLRTPGSSTRHAVFNESLHRPYKPTVFPIQHVDPPPPPDLIDDHEEYEVDSIKDSRFFR